MILARTLRRTFLLQGPLPDDCIAFLHTDPLLPAPTERTDTIAIAPHGDGLYAMQCSWGGNAIGSGRALARALDDAIYRSAASDEGSALSLNASVMRLDGIRLLLVAENGVDLNDITVALLVAGAAFEGTGLVFARADGFVAHPAKPRLRSYRLASAGLTHAHGSPPALHLDHDGAYCAIDPRIAGLEWSVHAGPVPVLLHVERNEGGRPAIARLRFEPALARLMRSLRSLQKPNVREFILFRALIEQARIFRVAMGDPIATAALVVTQMPHMFLDGREPAGHDRCSIIER